MKNQIQKKLTHIPALVALLLIGVFHSNTASAQMYDPVKWSFEVDDLGDEAVLIVKATIEAGWHVYSQHLQSDDGPIATSFAFKESDDYELVGGVDEASEVHTEYDPNFEMDLNYFENEAVFKQRIKKKADGPFTVTGEFEFMVCNEERCLPPEYVDMNFNVGGNGGGTQINAPPTGNMGGMPTGNTAGSGIENPVQWKYTVKKVDDQTYDILVSADIEKGWHVYSQYLPSDDGPIPTSFVWDSTHYQLMGKTTEPQYETSYDPNFEMDLNYFSNQVTFTQRIKVQNGTDSLFKGFFEYMTCNDEKCLPPVTTDIHFDLNKMTGYDPMAMGDVEIKGDISQVLPATPNVNMESPLGECGEEPSIDSAWMAFILGMLGGLFALLTPCVFPMIPLTVSFFTKGNTEQGKGVGRAALYGFFIFLIYVSLSIPFHFGADSESLNEIATSVWLNLIFFAVFLVFAFSFFGYYEITMPAKWSNKVDNKSQGGGLFGIFFMALTLALVSFSCTGPILGSVLGGVLKSGAWPITGAMAGFGLALGLPFALFAAFPSIMNKMPSSGGWLNAVKVVIGFVELALALKFLSNADLVVQWHIIERETFFLIWILIALGCAFYLYGFIRFPHDSPNFKLGPARATLATIILAFGIYLFPGVLPQPWWKHDVLSGFPPPMFYSWYGNNTFHAEFDDFEPAMAKAKELNKPLLVDFTGWACVNCRKMEESVWTVPEIQKIMEEEMVLVSLYVDDKNLLPEDKQGVFSYQNAEGETVNKKIKTIGNKWATFQSHVFRNNSQPLYVMLSPNGELLGYPIGYTPDDDEYKDWLKCCLEAFEKSQTAP